MSIIFASFVFTSQVFAGESIDDIESNQSISFDPVTKEESFDYEILNEENDDAIESSLPFEGTDSLVNPINKKDEATELFNNDFEISAIIGTDNRTRVTNTTAFPNRAIVHLDIRYPSSGTSRFGCTGFLVSADTVVTAGHCVYDHDRGGWATSITASPGRNDASYPYNSYRGTTFHSVTGWTRDGEREYDYGAIKLNGTPGNTTGWFGYRTTNGSNLDPLGQRFIVTGYPCTPPQSARWGTMWRDTGSVSAVYERTLRHNADTTGCQSGSPFYKNYTDNGWSAIAIHTAGSTNYNVATRITNAAFNNIQSWSR